MAVAVFPVRVIVVVSLVGMAVTVVRFVGMVVSVVVFMAMAVVVCFVGMGVTVAPSSEVTDQKPCT